MIQPQSIALFESDLSPQQNQIYELQQKGLKTKAIAETLNISYETVKMQIRRIKQKQKNFEQVLENALSEEDIQQLSGRQQQVVYLRRNGYKVKDAAKILGIAASTVRQYSYRANKAKEGASPVKKYILPQEELQAVISCSERRNRPVPHDTISMTYNILVKNDRNTREELHCLGISNCPFSYEAKTIALSERAKSFTAMTKKSLTYIEKEDLEIIGDVANEFFRHIKDNIYKAKTDNAQDVLEYTYRERKELLEQNASILIRKANSGVPGEAYPMQSSKSVSLPKKKGKVVGIKANAVIVQNSSSNVELPIDRVTICHRQKSYFTVCHKILRTGDSIFYNNSEIVLESFEESWPVKIISKT